VIDGEANLSSWSRFKERISVTLWTSFLAACLETAVFFAHFDPMVLANIQATPAWLALRPIAYAAGFFFFWAFTLIGSTLTAYMLDSSSNAPPKRLYPVP
jgi:hypothetical protein